MYGIELVVIDVHVHQFVLVSTFYILSLSVHIHIVAIALHAVALPYVCLLLIVLLLLLPHLCLPVNQTLLSIWHYGVVCFIQLKICYQLTSWLHLIGWSALRGFSITVVAPVIVFYFTIF